MGLCLVFPFCPELWNLSQDYSVWITVTQIDSILSAAPLLRVGGIDPSLPIEGLASAALSPQTN